MNKIETILFDFFGVLSSPAYKALIEEYVQEDEQNAWIERLHALDLGHISEDAFVVSLAEHVGITPGEIFRKAEGSPVRNEALYEFIEKELKPRYKVGLLTNAPMSLLRRLVGDRLTLFDPLLVSSELGMIKPSREIFEEAVRRTGTSAENILFIDDAEVNVDAARACGMEAMLYQGFDRLRTAMAPLIES